MRDDLANLQILSLPGGSTTGPRIVIDGINGRIDVFSEFGRVISLDSVNLPSGNPALNFFSAITGEIIVTLDNGGLFVSDGNTIRALLNESLIIRDSLGFVRHRIIQSGSVNAFQIFDASEEELLSISSDDGEATFTLAAADDVIIRSRTQADTTTRFFIETDGEMWWGPGGTDALDTNLQRAGANLLETQHAFNADIDVRVNNNSLPRGEVDFSAEASNVALSTSAGTYTTIIEGNVFAGVNGRKYRLSFFGGDNLLVAGSGFATTNAWEGRFQVSVNGGAYADVDENMTLARLEVAAATRKPIFTCTERYIATSDDDLQFRFQVTKSNGAGTVTSSMEGATNSWKLTVEDMGAT
jgi:hypothetical protein